MASEKLEKKAPKGVDAAKHERCVKDVKAQGKDVGSAHAICTSSLKKNGKEEPEIEVPAKEMVEEHEKLVDVLESESHEDDKKEAKKQKKELKEYKKEMKKGEDMDENTLAEIDKLAKSLADEELTQEEELFEVIKSSNKETMKKAFANMTNEQQELVVNVLEKAKYISRKKVGGKWKYEYPKKGSSGRPSVPTYSKDEQNAMSGEEPKRMTSKELKAEVKAAREREAEKKESEGSKDSSKMKFKRHKFPYKSDVQSFVVKHSDGKNYAPGRLNEIQIHGDPGSSSFQVTATDGYQQKFIGAVSSEKEAKALAQKLNTYRESNKDKDLSTMAEKFNQERRKMKKSEDIMEDTKKEETVEKAVKMDEVAYPEAAALTEKVMVGKVDKKKEQDEDDEKLVSKQAEAATVRHQGGTGEDGAWEGQVIKSDQEYMKETLVLAKSMGIAKEQLKEAIILAKGDFNVIRAILEKGRGPDKQPRKKRGSGKKGRPSLMGKDPHDTEVDRAMSSDPHAEQKASMMDSSIKGHKAAMKQMGKDHPDYKMREDQLKRKQAKLKDMKANMQKSIFWGSENELLKSSTKRGQNYHCSVEESLIKSELEATDRLSKSKFNYDHEEALTKSQRESDINDILEKGMDQSETEAIQKSRKQDPTGAYTIASFDVMQIAEDMGISEEEANELLGLEKGGKMMPEPKGEKLMKEADDKKKKKINSKDKTVAMGVRG